MMDALDTRHNNKYFVEAAGLMIEGLNSYAKTLEDQKLLVQKKLTPQEKKKLAKQQQKEEEERHLREQFAIEGHIFTVELQKKYDLAGQHLLSTLKS